MPAVDVLLGKFCIHTCCKLCKLEEQTKKQAIALFFAKT